MTDTRTEFVQEIRKTGKAFLILGVFIGFMAADHYFSLGVIGRVVTKVQYLLL